MMGNYHSIKSRVNLPWQFLENAFYRWTTNLTAYTHTSFPNVQHTQIDKNIHRESNYVQYQRILVSMSCILRSLANLRLIDSICLFQCLQVTLLCLDTMFYVCAGLNQGTCVQIYGKVELNRHLRSDSSHVCVFPDVGADY